MSSRPELKLDWCSHAAAKYAVEHWHYSKNLPPAKLVCVGVWENEAYIGAVVFSRGSNFRIGQPYGLQQTEICELIRVALRNHLSSVSRILSIAIKMLKSQSGGLKMVISYADESQGHHGGIYQASNWVYVGRSQPGYEVFYKGKWVHKRVTDHSIKDYSGWKVRRTQGKHTYLMPLDDAMRQQIEPLRKPYPKRAGSITADAATFQVAEGGAAPTPAL